MICLRFDPINVNNPSSKIGNLFVSFFSLSSYDACQALAILNFTNHRNNSNSGSFPKHFYQQFVHIFFEFYQVDDINFFREAILATEIVVYSRTKVNWADIIVLTAMMNDKVPIFVANCLVDTDILRQCIIYGL